MRHNQCFDYIFVINKSKLFNLLLIPLQKHIDNKDIFPLLLKKYLKERTKINTQRKIDQKNHLFTILELSKSRKSVNCLEKYKKNIPSDE